MMSKWPESCFIVFLVPKPFIFMGHMMKFDDFLFFIIFGYNLATSGYIWLQWCRNDLKPVSSCLSSQSHSFWWVIWWKSIIFYFSSISGRFGTVRPESWKSGFFGRNPALPVFFKYYLETCCQELGRSHTPFSGNYGFTFILGRFGPFWDRLAQIPDFGIFREKSGSVIFLQISSPNYLPGFRNILQAVFQNFES